MLPPSQFLLRISACAFFCLSWQASAAPLNVLAIGDSMTEEYAFELPFSAPDSNPSNANARNWPELFRIFRSGQVSLGPYKSSPPPYGDLRILGHEWNFSIPGATTTNWFNLLAGNWQGDPLGPAYGLTKDALQDEIFSTPAVVILLGANDLKQEYNDIFNDTEDPAFFSGIISRINAIHDWVRVSRGIRPPKIIVCTVPDVGATPQISGTYNVPEKQRSTRAKIAAFNQSIVDWAAAKPVPPTIARLDLLTDRVYDQSPFQINGTVFTLAGSRENPPTQVFCKDGFHPSTVAQAYIANEIIRALNIATGSTIPIFSDTEILRNVLGLDPNQPYLDWIAAEGLAGSPMQGDPDGDGVPNLVEYLLGSAPRTFGKPFNGVFAPGQSLSWLPNATGLRFGNLIPEESDNLATWTPVPVDRLTTSPDGRISATPAPGDPKAFLRLNAVAK